ncbi:assimilatory nitrite reductase small subunit [Mycolicibacterium madagascariense]|uniref:Assimilatory nitrite reductase small subunit n=1 Tax=Mycolicibacterium madagascariense TaxID=212765 RepID=A0A7I7X8J4_9MYCO|nr:Rieske 2Fe-2S domain-containing protein [Mycolicibacterium madagascariense]MCV7013407.1 Rieske 2Fe-2S domain-containing protein [Mycolicibacterium madagascariense]BBZ25874.1 assimilatory nitrite reductase small subunit [Mycolicibacterium madagascariense]
MTDWVDAGTLDDVWEGEMCAVSLGAVDVVLCHVDGEVHAYRDRCPHLANPLSPGELRDNLLTCPAHEWVFDARTGRGVNPEGTALHRLSVRVDGERILVHLGQLG